MLHLDPHRIIEARIAESMGFDKYKMIIEHVRKVDVSADLDFQRTYNGFYRIRRNAEWRAAYYGLFEGEMRNGGLPIMASLKKSKTAIQLLNRSFAHYTEIQEILKLHFPTIGA